MHFRRVGGHVLQISKISGEAQPRSYLTNLEPSLSHQQCFAKHTFVIYYLILPYHAGDPLAESLSERRGRFIFLTKSFYTPRHSNIIIEFPQSQGECLTDLDSFAKLYLEKNGSLRDLSRPSRSQTERESFFAS